MRPAGQRPAVLPRRHLGDRRHPLRGDHPAAPLPRSEPDAEEGPGRYPQLTELAFGLPDRVPQDVAKAVLACLEPDPADRPLPHELAEALEPALARLPKGRLAGFRTR